MAAILIIFALLLLNGFFSMCEIALVSSRRSRLSQKAKKGRKGAIIALRLLEEPEKFLSTVQIGITLVGIIAGAYGGEQFTPYVQPVIERSAWLQPVAEEVAFAVVVAVITYFTIIVGELVPKTIAFNNPEKITVAFAPFMRGLTIVAYPLVALLSFSTKLVLRIFFIRQPKNPPITEDELKYLIDTGARYGTIKREEGEMLHSVFRFGDQTAVTLMTPRNKIGWLNARQAKNDLLNDVFKIPYTKYPVCDGSLDNIIGVISVSDILCHINNKDFELSDHLGPAVFFSLETPALRILETFRVKKLHIGFVNDKSGRLAGLVTVHDLVENIIGSLPDTPEAARPSMIWRADGSLLAGGGLTLEEVLAAFNVPQEATGNPVLLGHFVREQLTYPVKAGAMFTAHGLRFEVMDVDGPHIDKVLVSRVTNL